MSRRIIWSPLMAYCASSMAPGLVSLGRSVVTKMGVHSVGFGLLRWGGCSSFFGASSILEYVVVEAGPESSALAHPQWARLGAALSTDC
jgi:hypothetical protein